jgi:hypothetical protein
VAALSVPPPAEAAGDYAMARLGMVSMLASLAAQEAERGFAARMWENGALKDLFLEATPAYDEGLTGRLSDASSLDSSDLSLSALDALNAKLRIVLIALHEAVEARGDRPLDRRVLELYIQMAHARRLELPAALGG